jgi:membrane-bound lytic murein transglycosylase B
MTVSRRNQETSMPVRNTARRLGNALAAGLSLAVFFVADKASADAGFRQWVQSFRSTAVSSGVSASTFDRAFRGVTDIDPEVLEKARYQPEFTAPVWDYFDNRVHEQSIAVGRQMAREWKPWLDRIEKAYGVDRHILLAIWSMRAWRLRWPSIGACWRPSSASPSRCWPLSTPSA